MKRNILLTTLLLFVIVVSSCQKEDPTPPITRQGTIVAESFDENFRIILYSEKDIYSEIEEIDIWGTIEYIGVEDSIKIYSGSPYMGYTVESEGVEYIQNIILTMLIVTTLEKGEIHEFPLIKLGGFSEDEADADFWREFYSEERMLFPVGVYQLTFSTGFYTDSDSDIELIIHYQFEVQ